jgi:hypothetical protein
MMTEKPLDRPEHLVDLWFRLKDQMILHGLPQGASAVRPPSLRDATYAYVLSMVNPANPPTPELTESFVNGLELGALSALRIAWIEKKERSAP